MSREKARDKQRYEVQISLISEVLRLANRLHRASHGVLMVKHDMVDGFNKLLDGDLAACALYQRNSHKEPGPLANACASRGEGPAARLRGTRKRRIETSCDHLFKLIARGPSPGMVIQPNVAVSFVHFPAEDVFAGVAISRTDGRSYSLTDRALLDAMHEELRWIYEIELPLASPEAALLTDRQRETFLYLLTRARETDIAARMGLGQNTVHHYVKRVYHHFDVSSRRELVARFHKPKPGTSSDDNILM